MFTCFYRSVMPLVAYTHLILVPVKSDSRGNFS